MKKNPRPQTLFDKIWAHHLVDQQKDGTCLIYIDRHLVHEVTTVPEPATNEAEHKLDEKKS